ncbi:MAG TPA: porin family protein [Chitinophagaceae bacterium]|nr:porin family protein [Chitinophagaceae bacterium]
MRKMFLITVSLLFFFNVVFSQTPVQFGLKAGINVSALKTNDQLSDHRSGYYVGGLAHIHLSRQFALQPEVFYSSQGAEYNSASKTKLNYINVPVLGQYMFGNGVRLQTGPQVGFITTAKSTGAGEEAIVKSSMKDTDFSWIIGASYLSPLRLGIDARYNLGIRDVSKNNADMRNRLWQVGLFYQFR